MSKNDFVERLKRIEEVKKKSKHINEAPYSHEIAGGEGFSLVWPISVLFALLLIFAGSFLYLVPKTEAPVKVATEQTKNEDSIWQRAVEKIMMTNLGDTDRPRKKYNSSPKYIADPNDPGTWREKTRRGTRYHSPSVLNVNDDVVFIHDIYEAVPDFNATPSKLRINAIKAHETCTIVRKPQHHEQVYVVSLDHGLQAANLQFLPVSDIAHGVDKYLTRVLSEQKQGSIQNQKHLDEKKNMVITDVILTDTAKPYYLVLEASKSATGARSTLWNIQASPGVKVAHVTVLARGMSGVVNLPDDTTLDIFDTSKIKTNFINPHDSPGYNAIKENTLNCRISPVRPMDGTWGLNDAKNDNHTLLVNERKTLVAYARQHDEWFKENFGFDINTNRIMAAGASHVLVGSLPATKITYQPISGAKLHILDHDYRFYGSDDEVDQKKRAFYTMFLDNASSSVVGQRNTSLLPPESIAFSDVKYLNDHKRTAVNLLFGKGLRDTARYAFDRNAYSDKRTVTYTELVKADWLYADYTAGKEHSEVLLLRAKANAAHYMARYCSDLLKSIATACHISNVVVKSVSDDWLSIKVKYLYLPNYDVGALAENPTYEFHSIRHKMFDETNVVKRSTKYRVDLLSSLVGVCDELREEYGTCALSPYIDLAPVDVNPKTNNITTQKVLMSAYFNVYGPRSDDMKEVIKNKVDEIFSKRGNEE